MQTYTHTHTVFIVLNVPRMLHLFISCPGKTGPFLYLGKKKEKRGEEGLGERKEGRGEAGKGGGGRGRGGREGGGGEGRIRGGENNSKQTCG